MAVLLGTVFEEQAKQHFPNATIKAIGANGTEIEQTRITKLLAFRGLERTAKVAAFVQVGDAQPEAAAVAQRWRELIFEVGGVDDHVGDAGRSSGVAVPEFQIPSNEGCAWTWGAADGLAASANARTGGQAIWPWGSAVVPR